MKMTNHNIQSKAKEFISKARRWMPSEDSRFYAVPPNKLYFHETSAHTLASKLSEPLESVGGLPRQVFT